VGNTLSSEVKEEIFISYAEHMKDENLNTFSKAKQLLIDILRIISDKNISSQETVKVQMEKGRGTRQALITQQAQTKMSQVQNKSNKNKLKNLQKSF